MYREILFKEKEKYWCCWKSKPKAVEAFGSVAWWVLNFLWIKNIFSCKRDPIDTFINIKQKRREIPLLQRGDFIPKGEVALPSSLKAFQTYSLHNRMWVGTQ